MYHTYIDWTLKDHPLRPFYVGKGLDWRVKDLIRRNSRHAVIRNAYGVKCEVILSTDEQCAFCEGKRLIAEFKARGDMSPRAQIG